jgi:MFS family permease
MGVLDAFVVTIALPTIEGDLAANAAELQLMIVGYILPYAGLLIVGGRVGDRRGHGPVFVFAVAGFALASVACSLAPSAAALIVARVAQGTCAGFMLPQVLALIRTIFTDAPARLKAMGYYAATLGLAAMSGHFIGGVIIALAPGGWTWRAIFLVNVPLALLSIVVGARILPRAPSAAATTLDWPSAVLQIAAVGSCLCAIILGFDRRGSPNALLTVSALVAIAVATAALFGRRQKTAAGAGREPLMPPRLLGDPDFRAGLLAVVLYYLAACLQIILVYHLQASLGLSPLEVALVFLPYTASFSLVSFRAAALLDRLGPDGVWRALALSMVPLVLLAAAILFVGPKQVPVVVATLLLVMGSLQGLVAGPMLGAVLGRIDPADAGVGSGILLTGVQFANAAGIALIGGLFFLLNRVDPSTPELSAATAILVCLPGVAAAAALLRSLNRRRPPYPTE